VAVAVSEATPPEDPRDPDQLWALIHQLRRENALWRTKYQTEKQEHEALVELIARRARGLRPGPQRRRRTTPSPEEVRPHE
jgi:hypothetical protein